MRNLLEYIVKSIVSNPDSVVIEELESENSTNNITYIIKVDENDLGILIGKNGKTIKSIRNIAKVGAIKNNKYVDVRISTEHDQN